MSILWISTAPHAQVTTIPGVILQHEHVALSFCIFYCYIQNMIRTIQTPHN